VSVPRYDPAGATVAPAADAATKDNGRRVATTGDHFSTARRGVGAWQNCVIDGHHHLSR